MKSTYKLLGLVWDRTDAKVNLSEYVNNALISNCILTGSQTVLLSAFFSLNYSNDLSDFLKKYKMNRNIFVAVDYFPNGLNKTVIDFYKTRLSQILCLLKRKFGSVRLIMTPEIQNAITYTF